MKIDWRRGGTRRVLGLALLAALGARSALARRSAARTVVLPPADLPGRPRLVEVLGGALPHGAPPEAPVQLLRPGRTVIGRSREADLRLSEETVSPRHAVLEVRLDGRVVLRDLGALNGVSVDGIPVSEVLLNDGNRLQLGDAVLVFRTDPQVDDGGRQGGELGERA